MGIRIIIKDRHRKTYPAAGGIGWSMPPMLYVPFPVIPPKPMMHIKMLQQEHNRARTTVMMMLVFLFILTIPSPKMR